MLYFMDHSTFFEENMTNPDSIEQLLAQAEKLKCDGEALLEASRRIFEVVAMLESIVTEPVPRAQPKPLILQRGNATPISVPQVEVKPVKTASRIDQMKQYLVDNGPSTRKDMCENSGIPTGTVSVYLTEDNGFLKDDDGLWYSPDGPSVPGALYISHSAKLTGPAEPTWLRHNHLTALDILKGTNKRGSKLTRKHIENASGIKSNWPLWLGSATSEELDPETLEGAGYIQSTLEEGSKTLWYYITPEGLDVLEYNRDVM